MKHIQNILKVVATLFLISYCIGVFTEANFNIVNWKENTREIISAVLGTLMIFFLAFYGIELHDNSSKQ